MSDYDIAARSGVSQPTVYRFLSGRHEKIALVSALAIARALGLDLSLVSYRSVEEMRDLQAEMKAGAIMDRTQATSALESQGLDTETRQSMHARIKQKLLAGPAKDLWSR